MRIAALLGDRNAGRPDEVRRVLDLAGNVVVEMPSQVPAPTWTTREPLLDAGQRVGDLEIIRSLRSVLIETAVIAAAAAALALAAFLALWVLPLRLLRRALERATHLATHDALTGLPNRAKFHERLDLLRIRARRQGGLVALIMVDLDRFKPVNDVYGHAAGDLLLQQVAERLVASLRETDTVARMGGDEFCMAAHIEDDDGEGGQRLTRRIVTAIAAPFHLGVHTVQIGCSLGITLATEDGMAAETLMAQADAALYRAKADGRNCFRFFELGMDAKIRERGQLEAELRVAIAQDELVPHYHPWSSFPATG